MLVLKLTVSDWRVQECNLTSPGRTPGGTAFSEIKELKPGEYAVFDKNKFEIKRYWSLKAAEHTDSFEETAEKIRYLLTDSIKRQLVSDVPLCCFLSGGLDSSIISATAAEQYREHDEVLTTYSVDYTDNAKYFKANSFQPNSDDYYIDVMSGAIGSSHKKVILDNDAVADAIYDATLARDLPGMADVRRVSVVFESRCSFCR